MVTGDKGTVGVSDFSPGLSLGLLSLVQAGQIWAFTLQAALHATCSDKQLPKTVEHKGLCWCNEISASREQERLCIPQVWDKTVGMGSISAATSCFRSSTC